MTLDSSNMQCDNTDRSLEEWPKLDVVNNRNSADGRVGMAANAKVSGASTSASTSENGTSQVTDNKQSKVIDNGKLKGGKSKPTEKKNNNENSGGSKRNSNKPSWKKLPINTQSYRDGKKDYRKRFSDFPKSFENNTYQNGDYGNEYRQGNSRGRGYRGNSRYRGTMNYNHRSYRQTTEAPNDNITNVAGLSESVVYYNQDHSRDVVKRLLRSQIEYYFSEENLNGDFYLRQKMNESGYVPVTLIATFSRVLHMTTDLSLIVEAVGESNKLELLNNFLIRPVVDPLRWPLMRRGPPIYPSELCVSNEDLVHRMGNLTLNNACSSQMPQNPVCMQYPPQTNIPPPTHLPGNISDVVAPINSFDEGVSIQTQDLQHLGACALPSESNNVPYYANEPLCDYPSIHFTDGPLTSNTYGNPSSAQQVNYYEHLPPLNHVIYFSNDQQSNGFGVYSMPTTMENLSNDAQISEDRRQELQNKSPEPAR